MNHQDRISIFITFVCGFLIGGYLYVTGFRPTYHLPEAVTKDTYDGLVVLIDMYGGCEIVDNCPSIQLLSDRSYRAVIGKSAEARTLAGTISRSAMNNLLESVTEAALVANSASLVEPQCQYTGEGASNLRVLVTYEGKNYLLDTCQSAIDYDTVWWQSIIDIYSEVAASVVS